MTKKKLLSAFFTLFLAILLLPTAASAVSGNYKVEVKVREHPEIQYKGRSTYELAFAVQSDDLYLQNGQSLLIDVQDSYYLKLLSYDWDTKAVKECGRVGRSYPGAVFKTYSEGEGPSKIQWSGEVYDQLGFSLHAFCDQKTSCKEEIELMSILIGIDDHRSPEYTNRGEDSEYVNANNIHIGDYHGSGMGNPGCYMTDGYLNTRYYCLTVYNDKMPDTLFPAPVVNWSEFNPEQKYKITFASGEGASGTEPEELLLDKGAQFQLPANPFTKENRTFIGWSDGVAVYQPGDTYTVQTQNVNFTAMWSGEKVVLEKLTIKTGPDKKNYDVGERFDSTGMEVAAVYSDGSSRIVQGWTVPDGEKLTAESRFVTITYTENGVTKTATQGITINGAVQKAILTGIDVTKAPDVTEYIVGQRFDSTGMEITASYSDGSKKVVTGWTVISIGKLELGDKSVTIRYIEGDVTRTTTQAITVKEAPAEVVLTGISVTKAPDVTEYTAGENFSKTGMEITAAYSDGSSKVVTGWTVVDGNALKVGDMSVTIRYTEGTVTRTATQAITVKAAPVEVVLTGISVTKAPDVTEYTEGESFDSTGMEITASYSDGSSKTVSGWTVSNGDQLMPDARAVTISYTEGTVTKTAIQTITVKPAPVAVVLRRIGVSKVPDKTEYIAGENFDSTGMEITAFYSDGSSKVVTDWTVSNGENLAVGDRTVIISYTEDGITKTIAQAITVEYDGVPVETYPIQAQFIKEGRRGSTKKMNVKPGKTIKAPNPNTMRQTGNCWMSEDGQLFLNAKEAVTYDQLLELLGGTAPEGSVVCFVVVSEEERPVDPAVKTIEVSFQLSGWGQHLEGMIGKTKTVSLEEGQSVKAPFSGDYMSGYRTVTWNSKQGLQVVSGDVISYEQLLELLGGDVSGGAEVIFTNAR